jgi:hypothetical protein
MLPTTQIHCEFIAKELRTFLRKDYPNIEVSVKPCDDDSSRLEVYFLEPKFASLYPWQRHHYISNLIPSEFYERHLLKTYWFALAPGESPSDLQSPGEELIDEITPDVMKCVERSGFMLVLDDAFCPVAPSSPGAACLGDFRVAKEVLLKCRFTPDEFSDVLHVLMAKGAFCDCEILYNIAEHSRYREAYWKKRAEGLK